MSLILNQLNNLDIEVLTDSISLLAYSFDNSAFEQIPLAVALPTNHNQVQKLIQFCFKNNLNICPRGKATSTSGAAVATNSSTLVISTEKMNQVLELNLENQTIRVQVGISNAKVQEHCSNANLFWPPDPSSMNICSIGGNLACNASGPRAFLYGSTRENVLSIKAIDGTGKSFKTGFDCTKYSAGYDLTRLFIGSEGTLVFMTEATLKLKIIPNTICLVQLFFNRFNEAYSAIIALRNSNLKTQSIELLDSHCLDLIREKHSIQPKSKVMLMVELIDFEKNKQQKNIKQMIKNCTELCIAEDSDEIKQMKEIRKSLSPAIKVFAPNRNNVDIVVPLDKLPDLFNLTKEISKKQKLTIINFGHAGNGNIHCNIMFDGKIFKQTQRAKLATNQLMGEVIKMGGAISGEHGIGIAKREFISDAVGKNTLELMKKIKAQFDPKGIMNPGKIWQ